MPRSLSTPVEYWTLALVVSIDAGFSITLLDLLPHVTFTGLYQPSGGCETPCGLRDFVPEGTLRNRFA